MNLHLYGKTAVVTGASKGIGLAITQALVGEGANVVTGSRQISPELKELAAHAAVHPVAVDLTSPDGPAALVDAAVDVYGGVDVLVNNVGGVRPRTGGFLSVTDAQWTETLTINFLVAVRTVRAALPHLLERGSGSIVTIASVNASLPDPLVIDYSAAKGALVNFSKSLSKEVGPRGIRVNTISPGPVSTDLWLGSDGVAATLGQANSRTPDEIAAAAAADSVTGRFSTPSEVAALVLLLAGDRAENVTGADLIIDGGLTTSL
ncbi:SDR family NAD(P)-dependent oxidoreductase [Cryptosporangium sp. NPDC048952]|uniref:SDR family NAD(P)-dependent oxidoreductase n=1 Tax=Cryptosporangium sp. NPDC048952 TaxID=3363961 RepID=UPI003710D68E